MQVFLAEKPILGCRGLRVTDEVRVTIAALACLPSRRTRGRGVLALVALAVRYLLRRRARIRDAATVGTAAFGLILAGAVWAAPVPGS